MILALTLLILWPTRVLWAQSAAIENLSLDPGLDTTAAPLGAITQTLDAYLHLPAPGQTPTDLWTERDRPKTGPYDLTAKLAYQGFRAVLLEISPTYDTDSAFAVKIAYYSPDSTVPSRLVALQRLYARPEAGRWVLCPALPRLTTDWDTTTVGRLTYHYAPGQTFDYAAAQRAATFVDSLAAVLHVQPPPRINYYLASSTDQLYRIIGFDYFLSPSGPTAGRGGYALTPQSMVFSGNPALGPAYTHELVHIVLRGLLGPQGRLPVMEEGTATWLGGSGGKSFLDLLPTLQSYQRDHPHVTLWNLLAGDVQAGWGPPETQALYTTMALLVDAVYRRGGTVRLRQALELPASTSLKDSFFPAYVGVSAAAADGWWRMAPQDRLEHHAWH